MKEKCEGNSKWICERIIKEIRDQNIKDILEDLDEGIQEKLMV